MSRVWILHQYATTPETGTGLRHHTFARMLAGMGHEVHMVVASWHHYLREPDRALPAREERDGYTLIRLPVPRYSRSQDPRRILNWISFARKLRRLPDMISEPPDAIFCASPSLLAFTGAEWLAKKTGARLIFEVRDIWPLTLQELAGFSDYNPLIAWMQRVEDRAYRVSDAVISNLPNAVEHMVSRGMDRDKFTWIPNGFIREAFEDVQPVPRAQAGLPEDKFVIGYAGTMGLANDLGNFVAAADLLRERTDIALVLIGRGASRDALAQDIKSRGLTNIRILPPISKDDVPAMLAAFDACHIGLMRAPLFRFGVSPNKLFEYFMAAKPITYAIDSGDYKPVEAAGAGIQVPPSEPEPLARAIETLADMTPQERAEMGARGRAYALERHEYGYLTRRLERLLFPKDDA